MLRFFLAITEPQVSPVFYYGQREAIIPDLFTLLGDKHYQRFFDPMGGSGSISFAGMQRRIADEYYFNDSFPIFKYLWELIKSNPNELIRQYSGYATEYVGQPEEKRSEFYNQILQSFNGNNPPSVQAAQFAFLINFADKNMPLYNKDLKLATQAKIRITESIGSNIQDFTIRTTYLSALLNKNRTVFVAGDYIPFLESAKKGDLVILDPPYPTQAENIYFRLKTEKALQNNLRDTCIELNKRGVDFIILYGALAVKLEDQFDEEILGVQHLVRLSVSRVHGEGLEHFYVSKSIPLAEEQLPKTMAFYHSLFRRNVEISPQEYATAVATLRLRRDEPLSPGKQQVSKL